jgi:hypothetical protein
VAITKSAFQQDTGGTGTSINCELEIANSSPSVDALDVQVKVSFVDSLGRSVADDTVNLTGIPAGQTMYATCGTFSNVSLQIASLQTVITVGRTQPKEMTLPLVSALTITQDPYGLFASLAGRLTNPYPRPMGDEAQITALYEDASGNLIGGDSEMAGASVEPQATVSFGFGYIPVDTASALVSVDPCGGLDQGPASCPSLNH